MPWGEPNTASRYDHHLSRYYSIIFWKFLSSSSRKFNNIWSKKTNMISHLYCNTYMYVYCSLVIITIWQLKKILSKLFRKKILLRWWWKYKIMTLELMISMQLSMQFVPVFKLSSKKSSMYIEYYERNDWNNFITVAYLFQQIVKFTSILGLLQLPFLFHKIHPFLVHELHNYVFNLYTIVFHFPFYNYK